MGNDASDDLVPDEIKGWNWGAFFLNWIWGLSHKVYISLLVFVPFVGFFVQFYLGYKGNELAWKRYESKDINEFRKAQKRWAIWGFTLFALSLLMSLLIFIFVFFLLSEHLDFSEMSKVMSDGPTIYDSTYDEAINNEDVVHLIGSPQKVLSRRLTTPHGIVYTGSQELLGSKQRGTIKFKVKKDGNNLMYDYFYIVAQNGTKIHIAGETELEKEPLSDELAYRCDKESSSGICKLQDFGDLECHYFCLQDKSIIIPIQKKNNTRPSGIRIEINIDGEDIHCPGVVNFNDRISESKYVCKLSELANLSKFDFTAEFVKVTGPIKMKGELILTE